jgi:hypothetical protein
MEKDWLTTQKPLDKLGIFNNLSSGRSKNP